MTRDFDLQWDYDKPAANLILARTNVRKVRFAYCAGLRGHGYGLRRREIAEESRECSRIATHSELHVIRAGARRRGAVEGKCLRRAACDC